MLYLSSVCHALPAAIFTHTKPMRTSFLAEALRCCVLLSLLLCAAANRSSYYHSIEGGVTRQDDALAFNSVPPPARAPGPRAGFWALSAYDLMLRKPAGSPVRSSSVPANETQGSASPATLYCVGDLYKKH